MVDVSKAWLLCFTALGKLMSGWVYICWWEFLSSFSGAVDYFFFKGGEDVVEFSH